MSEISANNDRRHTKADPESINLDLIPKRIRTYKDLIDEEERLTLEFKRSKERVMEDVDTIKSKLQPASHALNFMSKLSGGTGKPGLLSTGVDIGLDLLTKKYLFRGSGWLVTLAGSYLVRGVSQLFLNKARLKKDKEKMISTNGLDHPAAEETMNQ